ncbi:hypothetical protein, partial [Achromobacter xylosoxidans]|uniref:hypothetical protein n=2 Tax=Alcaligenes xylosoxydans xylosoxydans TaxID=85698 RepID=UPI001E33A06A
GRGRLLGGQQRIAAHPALDRTGRGQAGLERAAAGRAMEKGYGMTNTAPTDWPAAHGANAAGRLKLAALY